MTRALAPLLALLFVGLSALSAQDSKPAPAEDAFADPREKQTAPAEKKDEAKKGDGKKTAAKKAAPKNKETRIVAVYDLKGMLSESGIVSADMLDLAMGGGALGSERPLTMHDVVRSMTRAISDKNVAAVVLDFDQAGAGAAQLVELRKLLGKLVEAGKEVWIYTEGYTNGIALLSSTADHVVLMPEGGIALDGLYGESIYLKDLLDRYGVKVDVIHVGDFKAAGEIISRNGPSEQAAQQDRELMDDIFGILVRSIARGRDMEPREVRRIINQGFTTANEALEVGLVDQLAYRTDFVRDLRKRFPEAEFDKGYELPDLNGPEINGMMDLMKLAFSGGDEAGNREDHVAVIALEGAITDGSIAPVRKEILKAARNPKVKGLVFRVSSPGGSALASDVLWEATEEFKATGKPFAVSMGNVAASGGYYVAAGADRIFAETATITGSIGVIGMKMAYGPALERYGVHFHGEKRGRYADIFSPARGLSPAEIKLIRRSMEDVYATFKKRVRDGRGERLAGDLESMAGGRVFSGKRAKELGLVDQIGGLSDAIAYVARKAGVSPDKSILTPEPKGLLDGLFGPPVEENDEGGEFIEGPTKQAADLSLAEQLAAGGLLHVLDEGHRRDLLRALEILEASRKDRVLLLAPEISVRLR